MSLVTEKDVLGHFSTFLTALTAHVRMQADGAVQLALHGSGEGQEGAASPGFSSSADTSSSASSNALYLVLVQRASLVHSGQSECIPFGVYQCPDVAQEAVADARLMYGKQAQVLVEPVRFNRLSLSEYQQTKQSAMRYRRDLGNSPR